MLNWLAWKKTITDKPSGKFMIAGWTLIILLVPTQGFLSVWLSSVFGGYLAWRSWKEALILLMLGAAMVFLTRREPKLLRNLATRRINQLIAAYVVLHLLLAVVIGPNLEAVAYGLVYNLRFFGLFLIAQVIGYYWKRNSHNLGHLNRLVLGPAAVIIGFGLLQMFLLPDDFLKNFGFGSDTIEPFTTIDDKSQWVRISSLTRGANQLGQYLILPLILMGGLLYLSFINFHFSLKKIFAVPNNRVMVIGLLGGLAVMIGSYSRSAWLGLVVAVVSYLSINNFHFSFRKFLIPTVVAGVVVVGLVYAASGSENLRLIIFHDDQAAVGVRNSNQIRIEHTKKSLAAIAERPWGGGPGAAGPASFHNDTGQRINDNYYLQLALEVGLAGLALFLWISWRAAKNLWAQRQELWPKALLATFIGLALTNLFLPAWANEEIALVWWGLAGLWYKP